MRLFIDMIHSTLSWRSSGKHYRVAECDENLHQPVRKLTRNVFRDLCAAGYVKTSPLGARRIEAHIERARIDVSLSGDGAPGGGILQSKGGDATLRKSG